MLLKFWFERGLTRIVQKHSSPFFPRHHFLQDTSHCCAALPHKGVLGVGIREMVQSGTLVRSKVACCYQVDVLVFLFTWKAE